jgi:hypothetical protein
VTSRMVYEYSDTLWCACNTGPTYAETVVWPTLCLNMLLEYSTPNYHRMPHMPADTAARG